MGRYKTKVKDEIWNPRMKLIEAFSQTGCEQT